MKCLICGGKADKLVQMTYKGKALNDEACDKCATLFEALSWLTEREIAKIDRRYCLISIDPSPTSTDDDAAIIEAAERKKIANANKRTSAIKAHQRIKQQKAEDLLFKLLKISK